MFEMLFRHLRDEFPYPPGKIEVGVEIRVTLVLTIRRIQVNLLPSIVFITALP
jgi:hypothetical protein